MGVPLVGLYVSGLIKNGEAETSNSRKMDFTRRRWRGSILIDGG